MDFLNKIEMRGIVGRSNTQDGVTHFSFVTEYVSNCADGTALIETNWWHCITYLDMAGINRGDKLHIIGRLRQSRYADSDGESHTVTDIIINEIEKIDE